MHGDMGRLQACLPLLAASLITPCLAGELKTAAGVGIDLTSYKTFKWLPVKAHTKTGIVEDDPGVTPAVRTAVSRELTARGLTEVQEGGDLEVATLVLASSVPQLEAYIFAGVDPVDWGINVQAMGRYNREGTLVVNLIDRQKNKSAWAGLITETISNKPGAGAGKIPKAAEKLFSKYPVKKK